MRFDFSKAAKKIREIIKRHFTPIDLNEGNVQAIFNRCVSEESAPSEKTECSVLFPLWLGYRSEDQVIVLFDKAAIQADRKNIFYLYGQLKNVHMGNKVFSLVDAPVTYRDVPWTKDAKKILELLYLGCASVCISPFQAKTSSASLNLSSVKPTLSPKDPAFPEWWERHKAQWED